MGFVKDQPASLISTTQCRDLLWKAAFLLLIPLLTPSYVNAVTQSGLRERIRGSWEGPMLTTFRDKTVSGVINMTFREKGDVTVSMPEPEEGTYQFVGAAVHINIKGEESAAIILDSLRVDGSSLTGEVKLASDLPGIVNKIHLSKRPPGAARLQSLITPQPAPCPELDLPENVKALFRKFELRCPLVIPKHASYYEYIYIKLFVEEVIKAVSGARKVGVTYLEEGELEVRVLSNNEQDLEAQVCADHNGQDIEDIVKPLFQDPDKVNLVVTGCPPGMACMTFITLWTDLQKEFVRNARVDFDRVWAAIINVTDKRDGVELHRNTLNDRGTDKSIEGQREVYVPPDSGYLAVERLTIEIRDANKSERPGQFMEINVESRLWKRKTRSRRADEIVSGTTLSGSSERVTISSSDSPIMKRIRKAILSRRSLLP